MAEAETEQEPSIEEILESIRQIISDDDEEGGEAPAAEAEAEEAAPEAEPEPAEEDAPVEEAPAEEAPAEEAAAEEEPPAEAEEAPAEEPEEETAPEEDVLELTDIVEEGESPAEETPAEEAPEEAPAEEAVADEAPAEEAADAGDDKLVGDTASAAATDAMAKLAGNVAVERGDTDKVAPVGSVTLEDIVRDMMKPILREWLDTNLPGIVEKLVEKELQKISRRATDD